MAVINSVFPRFISHTELNKSEIQNIQTQELSQFEIDNTSFVSNLIVHLDKKWYLAKRAKENIERDMLKAKRQLKLEYEPSKLQAIQQLHGKDYVPVYMGLTLSKRNAAIDRLKQSILLEDKDPWELNPTPIPDLPQPIKQEIEIQMYDIALNEMLNEAFNTGQQITPEIISSKINKLKPYIENGISYLINKKAREAAIKMKRKISDQFAEGNWHNAINQAIEDLVDYKACIVKGPFQIKKKIRRGEVNVMTGKYESKIISGIVSEFKRISPFDFFPSPDSTTIDNGYTFERLSLSRKDLTELIGIEGFDENEIRAVLREHAEGGLREWTSIDPERAVLDQKENTVVMSTENIDCLEYWGSVPGKTLISWAGNEELAEQRFGEVIDPDLEYNIAAWKIGNHIIKAMLNPDPMGHKPYSKACFIEFSDSFWGLSLPDILEDIQSLCNAVARAIVNNAAFAAGPQIELNTDRKAPGESGIPFPFKVWETTSEGMNESPAVKFYMPPFVADKLIRVFQFFDDFADNYVGIPKYEQGDIDVGGAGKTATGLSMLMKNSSRRMESVRMNFDKIIIETVERQYYHNLDYEPDVSLICDLKPVARGSRSMITKEQTAIRRREFMAETNNPLDIQILGLKGRKKLLEEALKSIDIDTDEIWDEYEIESKLDNMDKGNDFMRNQIAQNQSPQYEKSVATMPSGDRVAGMDYRLFQVGEQR